MGRAARQVTAVPTAKHHLRGNPCPAEPQQGDDTTEDAKPEPDKKLTPEPGQKLFTLGGNATEDTQSQPAPECPACAKPTLAQRTGSTGPYGPKPKHTTELTTEPHKGGKLQRSEGQNSVLCIAVGGSTFVMVCVATWYGLNFSSCPKRVVDFCLMPG